MINWFLRIKSWLLFGLLFGLPLLSDLGSILALFASHPPTHPTSAELAAWQQQMHWPLVVALGASACMLGVYMGWLRAIGLNLLPLVRPTDRPRGRRVFRVVVWLPLTYLLVLLLGAVQMSLIRRVPFATQPLLGVLLLVLVHLLAMTCIFFCLYFAARVLRTAELQRQAEVVDFLGAFLLLWFSPVGLWLVQPRINVLAGRLALAA